MGRRAAQAPVRSGLHFYARAANFLRTAINSSSALGEHSPRPGGRSKRSWYGHLLPAPLPRQSPHLRRASTSTTALHIVAAGLRVLLKTDDPLVNVTYSLRSYSPSDGIWFSFLPWLISGSPPLPPV